MQSWTEVRQQLQVTCVAPFLLAARQGEKPDVHTYTSCYAYVFKICTNKPPYNFSMECYDFLGDVAETYAMAPGDEVRRRFLTLMGLTFKYLDRFLVKRCRLEEIVPMMERIMDRTLELRHIEAVVTFEVRVRSWFRYWAHDPRMLDERFHPDGPYAKRMRLKYTQV